MLGIFAGRQHNKIRELLSAYIDGEVSEAEAAQVDEHLEQCDECRAEFDSLSSTVNLLIALPQLELPRSFVLTEEPAPTRAAFSFVWPTRVAAGMAAAFLLALLLGDFAGFITQSSSFGLTFESTQIQPAAPAPAITASNLLTVYLPRFLRKRHTQPKPFQDVQRSGTLCRYFLWIPQR